jgi:hypothetical protein
VSEPQSRIEARVLALRGIGQRLADVWGALAELPDDYRADVAADLRRMADLLDKPADCVRWSQGVPRLNADRVAAVRQALADGPLVYYAMMKRLPGWNTSDVSAVLRDNPGEFRTVYDAAGRRSWEVGPTVGNEPAGTVQPPADLDLRLVQIAAVLRDGPMLPQAINAVLRWPPNYVSSALTRQGKMPTPWFERCVGGWRLADYGRANLARPKELAAARAAEKEDGKCRRNEAKAAAELSLLQASLANRTTGK